MGPRELFYADIFAEPQTGCRGQLGHAGRARPALRLRRRYLVEHDLFDFLLLSLPDNDAYSHKHGPDAQVTSIAEADLQLARVMHAGGGLGRVPRRARGDRDGRPLAGAGRATRSRSRRARRPGRRARPSARAARPAAEIAVCPSQRAAMVYALDEEQRDAMSRASRGGGRRARGRRARDVAATATREGAIIARAAGELRFAPGGDLRDPRGAALERRRRARSLGASVRTAAC